MKVQLTDKEIHSFTLSTVIEKDGEVYRAEIFYEPHDGYEVYFLDKNGERILDPEWVAGFVEELDEPLGYWLECQIDGFFTWGKEEANA